MKIFAASQVREIDSYTILNEPVDPFQLMERAAAVLTAWFVSHYSIIHPVMVMAGTGNNGGDGLAMARMLADRQYRVSCLLFGDEDNRSTDNKKNLKLLEEQGKVKIHRWNGQEDLPFIEKRAVLIDGLFGSGLSRTLEGNAARLTRHMNRSGNTIISIDIPSGLFGEDNTANIPGTIVHASTTLTFQFPFLSMFLADNESYVGKWIVLDIGLHPDIIRRMDSEYSTISSKQVAALLPDRGHFAHKGSCGHALVIAGSHGMMGAAVLAGGAALRGGAGLVTVHVPGDEGQIIQISLPEALLSHDKDDKSFTGINDINRYSAVAVGPGIGTGEETAEALKELLDSINVPLLLDADALNIIASHPGLAGRIPKGSILTPHPGEFDRLAAFKGGSYKRLQEARSYARKLGVYIVLKGAWTAVISPDGRCYFNTTGNPGMATGGSGDVLSGLIVSLLAQGVDALDAVLAGTYLHGLAGDLAADMEGIHAMLAGDITRLIGNAWKWILNRGNERNLKMDAVISLKDW